MGDAFTFNGTDVSTYGVTLVSRTVQAMADVSASWEQRGICQGGVHFGGQRAPKRWTDSCFIQASTESALRTYFDSFRTLVDPRGGDKLYVPDSEVYYTPSLQRGQYCRLNGPINATLVGFWCYQFELNWINVRGTEVDSSENTAANQSGTFNVTAGGNTYAHPTFTSTRIGGFVLTNNTTGESLTISAVPASDITINTWNRTITGTSGETTINLVGYMYPGGRFPRLQGATTNSFTISAGTVSLAWRNEWL